MGLLLIHLKMISRKGQLSIEFMIITGFVLLSFVIFFVIIQQNMEDKIEERRRIQVHEVGYNIQSEIDFAASSGDGYSRTFEIPIKLFGLDYTVGLNESIVYVIAAEGRHSIYLPVKESSGEIIKGTNIIFKKNGEVKLNP